VEGLIKVLTKLVSQPATLGIAVFGVLGLGGLVIWAVSIVAQSDKTVDITLTGIHARQDVELVQCRADLDAAGIQGSKLAAMVAGQQ